MKRSSLAFTAIFIAPLGMPSTPIHRIFPAARPPLLEVSPSLCDELLLAFRGFGDEKKESKNLFQKTQSGICSLLITAP